MRRPLPYTFQLRFILNSVNTVKTKGESQRKQKYVMSVAFDIRQKSSERCFCRHTGKQLTVGHQKQGKETTFVATVKLKQHKAFRAAL